LLAPFRGRIVLDIGTGDGTFVWKSARNDASRFYIGLDSNRSNLGKISERIYRKASKGGASNPLFIEASFEDLPPELAGIASEVQIQFPWGSLLRAVATADSEALDRLSGICAAGANIKIILSLDPSRDGSEMLRWNLPVMNLEYVRSILIPRYERAGFRMMKTRELSAAEIFALNSSWAKRIHSPSRVSILISGRKPPKSPNLA
jgi:16S rRNA (adenine(1408)-N(1))-methyltransferase